MGSDPGVKGVLFEVLRWGSSKGEADGPSNKEHPGQCVLSPICLPLACGVKVEMPSPPARGRRGMERRLFLPPEPKC